ncbi:MAG: hypothetical protein CVV41_11090 [Candidatus Riflebacteria bacterium HGW-Riflebacteria-1]|jgi:tetratricopeptide (TPR) repeat protein|nr:MAG: hypothetical protein CVV41_11090 [Candidatus Riflebacteria bacterium HGW-Riflebacteria-1]
MRANSFLVATILATTLSLTGYAADSSAILNQAQEFIKQKDYSAAKGLLARQLKIDRNSYKLWLALGYVYEADNDYEQALKAFMRASELQTGIDGLATRITRLQELVKSQPKKAAADSTDAAAKARELLNTARYKHSFKDFLESYKIFVEAVELDRSLLANDYGFIDRGLKYFSENANQPEHQFYLGAYNFYAGLYPRSEEMLADYIRDYPQGAQAAKAKTLLQECKDIIAQAKAAQIAAEVAAAAEIKTADARLAPALVSSDTAQPYVVKHAEPQFLDTPLQFDDTQQTYGDDQGESFDLAVSREKALQLLNEYDKESDYEKKHDIIWKIGVIRQPFPEVMGKFSSLLEDDKIETVFATLEALEKIDLPGAEFCLPKVYQLLGHKDPRLVYRAIESFSKMPMHADKIVPRLFNIYQTEKYSIRKDMIINTFKSYKNDAIMVLDAMIKEAEGPGKRPLAEIISLLTGEKIEEIINKS